MQLGIEEIASYIPSNRISNYSMKESFGIDDSFIENKLGVDQKALKEAEEDTSHLCVEAYVNLTKKKPIVRNDIEALVVVTQNPDMKIPHVSAIVHGKLDLSEACACFDISLGCTGFVHGLSIIHSFMQHNGFKKGLLFTADPYSKIIDKNDKNTFLLFGDAATVTLISDNPLFVTGKFSFGTIGKQFNELFCHGEFLYMNGRSVFNFSAKYIPLDVSAVLKRNNMTLNDIDRFVFHQGSKFIVDAISKSLKLSKDKVPFDICSYGNTVSSSIPLILEKEMKKDNNINLLASGFGVGLSWASTILKRKD